MTKPIALEARISEEERLFSPSVARNRDPIAEKFAEFMPHKGKILEIASGTGEHAMAITAKLPALDWVPSDPDAISRRSVDAWRQFEGRERVKPALNIATDISGWTQQLQDEAPFAGMLCINMIHIAPFEACIGLFEGAGHLLAAGGKLFLYGPFLREGATAASNMDFDQSLKSRDPKWGVRDLDKDIFPLAQKNGLMVEQVIAMPANNLSVIFVKSA